MLCRSHTQGQSGSRHQLSRNLVDAALIFPLDF